DRTIPLPHITVRLESSRDGRYVIPGKYGGKYFPAMDTPSLGVYQTASGEALGPTFRLVDECADAAVSGGRRTAAAVVRRGRAGILHLWDPRTGRATFSLPLGGPPTAVAFNADDTRVGVLSDTGEVILFDPQTSRARMQFQFEDWTPGRFQTLS